MVEVGKRRYLTFLGALVSGFTAGGGADTEEGTKGSGCPGTSAGYVTPLGSKSL